MLGTFIASYLIAGAATPLAMRIARRTGMIDHPVGYKAHAKSTPYLGGGAILCGFFGGAIAYGAFGDSRFSALFVGAAVLWLLGTIDDRVLLRPPVRVLVVASVAVLVWESGLGWSLLPGEIWDLIVTVLWILGVVNAFNLMDNLDGAAGTVAAASAAGIALLAAYEGPEIVAALAVAVCGSCIGFLHFNLTKPAKIFMGDGGSMLLGFLIAVLAMAVVRLNGMVGPAILPAILLVGLPVLDMTLVIVSRLRRNAPVGKGGRDHMTHRLMPKLGSTWGVAAALALAQCLLSATAIALISSSRSAMYIGAAVAFVMGVATIALLESPSFRPVEVAAGEGRGPRAPIQPLHPIDQTPSRSSQLSSLSSELTPSSEGATSGRSIPRTGPGP